MSMTSHNITTEFIDSLSLKEELLRLIDDKMKDTYQILEPEITEKFPTRQDNPFYILGAYPEIGRKYVPKEYYGIPTFGLYKDNDYCEIVDYYNLLHPENIFQNLNFFTDYSRDHEGKCLN